MKKRRLLYQQEIDQVKAVTVDHEKQLAIVKQKTSNFTQGMYFLSNLKINKKPSKNYSHMRENSKCNLKFVIKCLL